MHHTDTDQGTDESQVQPHAARRTGDSTLRLDLSNLRSPVKPVWLNNGSDTAFTLPFETHLFDLAVVGSDTLATWEPPRCYAELSRVVKPGGYVDVHLETDAVEKPDYPELLNLATQQFRIHSVAASDKGLTIRAVNRTPDSEITAAEALRALSQGLGEYLRNVADAAPAAREAEKAHARVVQDLEAARRLHGELRRSFEKNRQELGKAKNALQLAENAKDKNVERLRAELVEARWLAEYERWRAQTILNRKASRVADELRELRRPWLLLHVLYRILRIVFSKATKIPPPVKPRAIREKEATEGRATEPQRPEVNVTPAVFPVRPPSRPNLKVAAILDEFSQLAFRYEFDLILLPSDGWRELIDKEQPDLLLAESAWHGNDGEWKYAFTGNVAAEQRLTELIDYCRKRRIPTVFWNKEDPLEYDLFLRPARLFDWVFTVDEGCVEKYRLDLGHDRVGVLPFGAQPQIHNPISSFKEKSGNLAFAGTYYSSKYPERKQQMDTILAPVANLGLHIFSRIESDPRYRFPGSLQKYVVGSLKYPQTVNAYRKYKVFLNVNSVIDSNTMFSRRVLELLACGTPVVSGPSPGMTAMLGPDVVGESTDPETTRHLVRALLASAELRDRQAVKGIRAVMSRNTYSHRVDQMLTTLGFEVERARQRVSVICPTNRIGAIPQIIRNASVQHHGDLELVIGLHGVDEDHSKIRKLATESGIPNVQIVNAPADWSLGRVLNELCAASDGDFIARMDDDDFYGPNYLSDQLLAFVYTEADVVGKWTRFILLEDVPCLGEIFPGNEHTYTKLVGGPTILGKRNVFEEVPFPDLQRGEDTQFLHKCEYHGIRIYSTDRFNYVYMRHTDQSKHTFRPHALQHLANTRVVSVGSSLAHAFV